MGALGLFLDATGLGQGVYYRDDIADTATADTDGVESSHPSSTERGFSAVGRASGKVLYEATDILNGMPRIKPDEEGGSQRDYPHRRH